MVEESQIISIKFPKVDIAVARRNARKASLGGVSRMRDREEREAFLGIDQLVGQLGQIAGHRWLYGHPYEYAKEREIINRNPRIGDTGSDVACANIDFKGSLWRYREKPLLDHHLLVRPKERHKGFVYILILIELNDNNTKGLGHLIGWANEAMLPEKPETSGVFEGAFSLSTQELYPLPPFNWSWSLGQERN